MSGSRLKWIAIVTMFIDHVGASLVEYYLRINDWASAGAASYSFYYNLDIILRSIGRIAFPLFIFLLVEGFFHTGSRTKYLIRLAAFSAISDIPFDLALFLTNAQVKNGVYLTTDHQNVFFTLTLGFLGMLLAEKVQEKWKNKAAAIMGLAIAFLAAGFAAELLCTDYGAGGTTAIIAAYAVKKYAVMRGRLSNEGVMWVTVVILAIMSSISEAVAFVDVVFIRQYDGSRGKTISKWFFYIFYPAHLFILFLIRYWLF